MNAVRRGAVNITAEPRAAQERRGVAVREERGRARLLRGHVEAEDGRVGRSEDAEHVAVNGDDSNGDARRAPQWLSYRRASYVCLPPRLSDDAQHVRGRQRV